MCDKKEEQGTKECDPGPTELSLKIREQSPIKKIFQLGLEPEAKDASWGRLFQVEGTAKVGENTTSLGQMQGVSSLEPWRGILSTLREERPDVQDLREPDSLNIFCTVIGDH